MTHLNDTLTDREVDYWVAQLDTQFNPPPAERPGDLWVGFLYAAPLSVAMWWGIAQTVACLGGWWLPL